MTHVYCVADDSGFRIGNYDLVAFEQDTVHHDD